MKMFVEPADVYLYMDIVDFRKSINGLIVVVEQNMELNAFRDALFVFAIKSAISSKYSIGIKRALRFGTNVSRSIGSSGLSMLTYSI